MKIICSILCCLLLCGCSSSKKTSAEEIASDFAVTWDAYDLDSDWSDETAETIRLQGNTIQYEGVHASITDSGITIKQAGTYRIHGTLDNGSIIIDDPKNAHIKIVLDDARITCDDHAPIYIKQADKVVLTLADGTDNTLEDGTVYHSEDTTDTTPSATIYSEDDLTINGNGSLRITANYNNAIQSKDDLKIVSGTLQITAANDGLVGRDLLAVKDASITLNSTGDAMKSTNEEQSQKGNIVMEGGTITIRSQADGIQAANGLYVYGGTIQITSGGGSVPHSDPLTFKDAPWETSANTEDTISTKGMKSENFTQITGGTLYLDSLDDAIHTNGILMIQGGSFQIKSGDDGIHADTSFTISQGTIVIEESYEGIESSILYLDGGDIHITASDDGLNAAGKTEDSDNKKESFTEDTSKQIFINGTYVYIDAGGDGIDSNGSITMSKGTVIINGPADNGNGALDFNGAFTISGGYLLAAGSSGMLQTPTDITNGNCIMAYFPSTSAPIHIQDESGKSILTFQPAKSIQSIILYSADLKTETTYEIYMNGVAEGTQKDGIYSEASYSSGTLYDTFTIQSNPTIIKDAQQTDTIPKHPNDMQNPDNMPPTSQEQPPQPPTERHP